MAIAYAHPTPSQQLKREIQQRQQSYQFDSEHGRRVHGGNLLRQRPFPIRKQVRSLMMVRHMLGMVKRYLVMQPPAKYRNPKRQQPKSERQNRATAFRREIHGVAVSTSNFRQSERGLLLLILTHQPKKSE